MNSQSFVNSSRPTDKSKTTSKADKSYLEKYKKRLNFKQKGNSPMDSVERAYIQEENSNRGQRIFELFNAGENIQKVKIEEEEEQSILMRNQYLETELLWFKKIDETKHEISTTKQMCEKQAKVVKDLEKELANKRIKLTQLTEKLRKAVEQYDNVYVQTYEDQISALTQEYESTFTKGAILVNEAKTQRQELLDEIQQEDRTIEALEQEIAVLSDYESDHYQGKLSQLLDQEDRLKYEISKMQEQIQASKRQIKHIDSTRPIPEENHRKYLELYQKIFLNRQLDVMEGLVKKKQTQIDRLEDYEKKKTLFKLKKRELSDRQAMYGELKKTQQDLQEEIRQKSTILLNLYQYENQQIR